MTKKNASLKKLQKLNDDLLYFCEVVARSACLKQMTGEKCVCFSCEAKRLIDKSNNSK